MHLIDQQLPDLLVIVLGPILIDPFNVSIARGAEYGVIHHLEYNHRITLNLIGYITPETDPT
jgi:hypothetical protein